MSRILAGLIHTMKAIGEEFAAAWRAALPDVEVPIDAIRKAMEE